MSTGAEQPADGDPVDDRFRWRDWPRALRWVVYLAGALAVLLVIGMTAGFVAVRQSWPETTGTVEIRGLDGTVEVIRDANGIPQLYGDSMRDLVLAQGYVHAQERFFEMDVRRHATAGRLSELFGEAGLPTDLLVRTLGWRRVAEQELRMLDPDTRDLLDAYARGVNAYLEGRGLSDISLEYTLLDLTGLDYQPEDWTAVDSIAWLKAMAWDLRGNLDDELGRVLSAAAVGDQRAAELYPPYPYDDHPPIVGAGEQDTEEPPGGVGTTSLATNALAATRAALDVPPLLGEGDGIGSNGWVVSGDRTTTGAPILANDPHLGVSMPGVWMQVGLHCREVTTGCPMDVAGFSFSGVPGVIIGHNADIAWGFTNLGPDVTDLYVERVRGDQWQRGARMRDLTTRTERIEVRDGETVSLPVRETAHGPIVSDLAALAPEGAEFAIGKQLAEAAEAARTTEPAAGKWEYEVSLAWTSLTPQPTADAVFGLNLATDWTSFRDALSDFAVPGQNVVYADTAGHIGYQATGLVPVRKPGHDGTVPVPGWRPAYDWTGRYVPFDAMPRTFDPESGRIVTANQAAIGADYPYRLTEDWDRGYRSARIGELLADDPRISVAETADLQLDDRNPMAPVLTPYLLGIPLAGGYADDGQALLRDWDFHQPADSAAAAYYNATWRALLAETFHDELPEDLWPDGGQRWFAVVTSLLEKPNDAWWDDVGTEDVRETRDDVLEAALLAARDELTALQSPDPDEWSWGELHELDLRSSTLGESGIAPIEALFNRGGFDAAGGGSLVNATSWDASEGYAVTAAPSMRMIVPLDDLDAARWVNLTGVSGHAFHPHYADQTELWIRGETLAWPFSRDAVVAARDEVQVLAPSG